MKDIAIRVDDVTKVFKLPREKHTSIKSMFINIFRRNRGYDLQHALDHVSFEVKKGEFFGIVGRNGSGKSTLLKMLAGIYVPTSGTIEVNGHLTPFIELGVGFNMDLTGRENVFLNGALLGFNRKEMNSMYKDIVDFAELKKFMDLKLKNYSSGMQVRLAFSIAIRAQSNILLLDEVLAVGDIAFQQKCFAYFETLKREEKTVVLVTHDMGNIEKFCDRAMLIDNGKVVVIGDSHEVAEKYIELNK
jgi:ABC-2 type transport system ATP-binding protein